MIDSSLRFLCDEMLGRLGHWLRAAGYDTLIAGRGAADLDLLAAACSEDRILITCDRALAQRRLARGRVVLLPVTGVEDGARRLSARLPIDWLARPFTRCLLDNAPLGPATPDHAAAIPPAARALGGDFNACPLCGRVYWPGSHVRRMRRRLEDLQRAVG
jgi:uncharacterized protein with PIN domain